MSHWTDSIPSYPPKPPCISFALRHRRTHSPLWPVARSKPDWFTCCSSPRTSTAYPDHANLSYPRLSQINHSHNTSPPNHCPFSTEYLIAARAN
ncbi:uncharacterized protein YALI1_A07376g [Yarrowia lipolytica]|uniref:Uncharacterized protein n=1 Tax=Yarrowia lipolytica TaxID=4952 RepID=A0A1D8N407_YARLL|nr:hypothetical protein YALI1_A07376g [Yarrowia lipolytica]